ncbi:MAG: fibronectin type III domain-containing protein, partial [Burkholderiaceae bacterium]|nr:fibronectin type III domain-containing protein [Burkholderiaceae bacterium]
MSSAAGAVCQGAFSTITATPMTSAGAPRTISLTSGDSSLSAQWSPPSDLLLGGGAITGYKVELSKANTSSYV